MGKFTNKELGLDTFLIFGYGKFGQGFAKKLLDEGVKETRIFIIDKSEEWARKAAALFSNVYHATVDDFERLNDIGININDISIIVIAMTDIEDSLMLASNRKKYPDKIFYAKAKNDIHKKLLKTLGIDEVVIPEIEVGSKLAYRCLLKNCSDIISINSSYNIVNFKITTSKYANMSISELNLKKKFNSTIIGINRDERFIIPDGDEPIKKNDFLNVVVGKDNVKNLIDFFASS